MPDSVVVEATNDLDAEIRLLHNISLPLGSAVESARILAKSAVGKFSTNNELQKLVYELARDEEERRFRDVWEPTFVWDVEDFF